VAPVALVLVLAPVALVLVLAPVALAMEVKEWATEVPAALGEVTGALVSARGWAAPV
jgi:hypothetical protein